jgi:hypothetical protein
VPTHHAKCLPASVGQRPRSKWWVGTQSSGSTNISGLSCDYMDGALGVNHPSATMLQVATEGIDRVMAKDGADSPKVAVLQPKAFFP